MTRATFGAVIVIRRGSNGLSLYEGMKLQPTFRVATGESSLPDPARPLRDCRHVEESVVVPAALRLGEGREADPARSGQPARHALDGDLRRPPSASTARPTPHRSATPSRTAASACRSPRSSGSSTRSTSGHPSTSSGDRTSPPRRSGGGRRDRGGAPRAPRLEADAGRERRHLAGALQGRHAHCARVHARAPRRQGRPRARVAARKSGRPQLLGLVVRPLQGRDTAAAGGLEALAGERTSSSSAST